MMLVPRKDFNVFDDFFKDSFFDYRENSIMKTDIKENEDSYELVMDLPGIPKENIKMHINNGYLVINAYTTKEEENHKKGKFVKKERYYGECSRSFYIGEEITENDIKANFKDGTLNIMIPKIDKNNSKEEIKYIEID